MDAPTSRSQLRRGQADLSFDADGRAATAMLRLAAPAMTLNVVLKPKPITRPPAMVLRSPARRSRAAGWRRRILADRRQACGRVAVERWPLDLIEPENIDLIETNLQIAHAPKSATRDFRTDYLLKVFHYNARNRMSSRCRSRTRSIASGFSAMIISSATSGVAARCQAYRRTGSRHDFDPGEFLATAAIAATPAGFAASNLQPAFGLVQGDDANAILCSRRATSSRH